MTLKSLRLFSVLLVIFIALTSNISEARRHKQINYRISRIPNSANAMSEGPHWDAETQSLYYVDINTGTILRYSYVEKKVYRAKVVGEEFASFIIPVEGSIGEFAVGCGRAVKLVLWDGYSQEAEALQTLFEFDEDEYDADSGIGFNDGKCDSQGRLFAGTMNYTEPFKYRSHGLYAYERFKQPKLAFDHVGISNGLAWNDDTKKFYFADTASFDVREYGYNMTTGTIDGRTARTVLDLHKGKVQPDGMTIDTEGNIYVATFNASTVYKVDPSTEKVLLKIKLPCEHVTSVAFGGPKLSSLFVTTANVENEPSDCGYLYEVTELKAKGHPMNKIKIY